MTFQPSEPAVILIKPDQLSVLQWLIWMKGWPFISLQLLLCLESSLACCAPGIRIISSLDCVFQHLLSPSWSGRRQLIHRDLLSGLGKLIFPNIAALKPVQKVPAPKNSIRGTVSSPALLVWSQAAGKVKVLLIDYLNQRNISFHEKEFTSSDTSIWD